MDVSRSLFSFALSPSANNKRCPANCFVLKRRGIAPRFLPPISMILANAKNRYIDGLNSFRGIGVNEWIEHSASATFQSAKLAQSYLASVRTLQSRWRKALATSEAATRAEPLPGQSSINCVKTLKSFGYSQLPAAVRHAPLPTYGDRTRQALRAALAGHLATAVRTQSVTHHRCATNVATAIDAR